MGYKKTIMFLLVLGIVCLGSVYAPDFFDSGDTATQHTMTVSQTQSWYISEINDTELFYDIDSVSYDGKDFKVNLKAVDEIKDIEKDAKSLPDGSIAVKDKEDKEIEDKEKEPKELVVIADSETVSTIEELKTKLTIKAKDYGTGEDKETISFFDDFNRTTGKHNYSYDVLADYSYTAMVDTYDDNGKMNGSVLKEISVARDEVILKLGDNSIYITATLGTDLKVLQTTTNDTGYVSSIDVSEGRLFAGQTNSSYDLTSDMVLWMSMDNFNISNDKIWDYSGENNHGTTYPTATLGQDKWVTGQIGNALSFDGSNDYINCGNDLSHNFSSESFTLEAWIKPDETSTERYIIEKRKEGSFVGISIDSSDNPRFYFRDEASVSNAIKSSNTYIDTFVHIVATRDYGNAFHLYVDGNEVGSGVADTYGLMFGEEELFIGSADGVSNFANGIIDDVRIYGRALTGAEVNDSYWRGSDGLETNVSATGLVLWSKLDESNYDNTAFDSSSESNDGVLHNYPPMVTAGNISNAIYFDGFDDYILCDDDIELGTADFTVSVWTKKGKHTSIYDSIISQGQTGADEWLFYFYSSTSIRFYADSGAINTESQTIPDINDWRMFTFIRDGDYGYLYNNVTLIKTISGIDDVNLNTAYKVSIGASLEGMQRRYNGTIDDVRIYSRALSIDELTARYQMTADNYDTTTEAISHSAITYDTVSNTNDTLIVNVPEVRYDLTFAPTYIKDTNLTVIDIETGVIDRYGWGNDAYGRQLTTDPDYLISG
ncbi:MAG: LamG domain-containing protein, partial [Candidatus Peribacteraceae bacterium]|nr:LamG domain-containing protein [Candidatus Peribacteraceae bacterium]